MPNTAVANVPEIATPPISPGQAQVSAATLAQQMQGAIQAISPGTTAGIDVVDMRTGDTVADLNSGQQFYTASVVKLLIAIDALKSQNWQPDPGTSGQIQQMLSTSDDDIADDLWVQNGSDDIVNRMIGLIGLSGTTAPGDDGEWGETLTTPRDVVTIYQYIENSVPEPSRDLIMNALRGATATAADGTNQYFGIPDAFPGYTWAVKQGWMDMDASTTLDTTGLVGPSFDPLRYAVVVLSTQPAGTNWTVGGAALTAGVALLHVVMY
ncbi:hypothetical protein ACIP5Y_01675 [Nocardia sp. NPDC088792]|uniref:hypothetical protein n=1 Tax=Nocardia sp. NPDC088792 TaxID=3364332 RepID=UPI003804DEB1